MRKGFFICLALLLFPLSVHAKRDPFTFTKWKLFNSTLVYKEPLAAPHSPEISLSLVKALDTNYLKASIGRGVSLVTLEERMYIISLGFIAGVWLTLDYESEMKFPLMSEDFLVSLPLTFRQPGVWSVTVKWNHYSAHLGDGAEGEPFGFSRDFISVLMSGEMRYKRLSFFPYINVGHMYKNVPKEADNPLLNIGIDTKFEWNQLIRPYIAIDVSEDSGLGFSGQTGVAFTGHKLAVRIAFFYYLGADRRGQFFEENIQEAGLGIFIR
jgi:hypothetical protein